MAAKANLIIDQGSTYNITITVLDENSDPVRGDIGLEFRGQIRKHYTSSNSVNFDVSLVSNGLLSLSLTSTQTTNMVAGRYVYDVEMVDTANNVIRIIEGIATITPEVTR